MIRHRILLGCFTIGSLWLAQRRSFEASPPPHGSLAAPRIIIIYGPPLERPVLLADWRENLALMMSLVPEATIRPKRAAPADSLRLALCWGSEWNATALDSVALAQLAPNRANQSGWLFITSEGWPMTLVLTETRRGPFDVSSARKAFIATQQTRSILRRHLTPLERKLNKDQKARPL